MPDGGSPGPEPAGFRALGEEELVGAHVIRVARARFCDPDGEPFERTVVRHPGAVAVVPLGDDGTVTLVRQFRAPLGEPVLEIPAGTLDVDGEAPERAARRELAEEAGLAADRLEHLVTMANTPGVSDQRTAIYLATGLTSCETDRAGVEERWMTLETMAIDDLDARIADGSLVDATTVLGLLLARQAAGRPGPPGPQS